MGFACVFLLGRAGEPIRPILIAKKDSISTSGMFGVYVLERVLDLAATAVLAGIALLLFERKACVGGENDLVMKVVRSAGVVRMIGLVAVVTFLIYFRYHGAGWLARKLQQTKWRSGWRGNVALLLEGFSEGLQGIRTWNDLGALIGYFGSALAARRARLRAFPAASTMLCAGKHTDTFPKFTLLWG